MPLPPSVGNCSLGCVLASSGVVFRCRRGIRAVGDVAPLLACDPRTRSALGLVWVPSHLPPKVVEQQSVSSFQAELQRLVKDRATARCAHWAQSLSPRTPLSSHPYPLPVSGHVRLSPKILRHRLRNRTAQQPMLVRACDAEAPAPLSTRPHTHCASPGDRVFVPRIGARPQRLRAGR